MFIGVDVGTSGIKAILGDGKALILDSETVKIDISRPHPLWSEQNPDHWVDATYKALDALAARQPEAMSKVRAIGLAGQMHGAVVLGRDHRPLRPAILWNDGRCEEQCKTLEAKVPALRTITGNIAMPGFTAPKLLWIREKEPEIFSQIVKVLLPKDYVRFVMTGAFFSDMSDAAGTLWVDVGARAYSQEMLAACDLTEDQMPQLCEGSDQAGFLKPELAARWGMKEKVVFAGGAGDNASGAVGMGVLGEGDAFISLGTSGVYFTGTNAFRSCPEKTVHSFCHALPNRWHQMGVILSAASCIKTATRFLGAQDDASLAALVNDANYNYESRLVFLPYLSGERTPHNNPSATGMYFGLTHETTQADMVQAILEGVAFAFADCQTALAAAGSVVDDIMLIGGGARNKLWGKIIGSALNKNVVYVKDGEQGPAFGAARLARLAATGEKIEDIAVRPDTVNIVKPDMKLIDSLLPKMDIYNKLYCQVEGLY